MIFELDAAGNCGFVTRDQGIVSRFLGFVEGRIGSRELEIPDSIPAKFEFFRGKAVKRLPDLVWSGLPGALAVSNRARLAIEKEFPGQALFSEYESEVHGFSMMWVSTTLDSALDGELSWTEPFSDGRKLRLFAAVFNEISISRAGCSMFWLSPIKYVPFGPFFSHEFRNLIEKTGLRGFVFLESDRKLAMKAKFSAPKPVVE